MIESNESKAVRNGISKTYKRLVSSTESPIRQCVSAVTEGMPQAITIIAIRTEDAIKEHPSWPT